MIIRLQKRKYGIGGVKIRKRFLFFPLVHKKTVYWLEYVKLHYAWNGRNWVIIDVFEK